MVVRKGARTAGVRRKFICRADAFKRVVYLFAVAEDLPGPPKFRDFNELTFPNFEETFIELQGLFRGLPKPGGDANAEEEPNELDESVRKQQSWKEFAVLVLVEPRAFDVKELEAWDQMRERERVDRAKGFSSGCEGTEQEVMAIAEHEHVPEMAAAGDG